MIAPAAGADVFQTANAATRARKIATQSAALTARRTPGRKLRQRSCGRPTTPRAAHHPRVICPAMRRRTSGAFRCPLAEEPLGTEHEDEDEDREDDRLRPVAARHVPGEALVVRLDEADRKRAEDRARE